MSTPHLAWRPARLPLVPLLAALLLLAGCVVAPDDPLDPVGQAAAAVCSSVSFTPSPANAAPGTTVTWTASAGCATSDTPTYQFWMQPPGGSWAIVQPYGTSDTYTWTTTGLASGLYDFEVWTRAQGSTATWESYQDRTFDLSSFAACSGGALSFSPAGTVSSPGTTVTLIGSASCGGTPEYEFWMQPPGGSWSVVQPYGASSTYAWSTTGLATGTYDFEVWVKNQGSSTTWETYQDRTQTLETACAGGVLSFNPPGSSSPGTNVTLTGSATCGGTAEYEFWMQPPGGSWSIVQPYGASSTYAWSTTGLATGTYDFEVWVKNQGSGAAWETYQDATYTLTSGGPPPAPCTGSAVSFNPPSPWFADTTVTLTGSATCGGTPEYEFWMQPPGGAWSIVQPYGASNTYAWSTTGLATGSYDFEVWVKNQGSGASFETYLDQKYSLMPVGPGAPAHRSKLFVGDGAASPGPGGDCLIPADGTVWCYDTPAGETIAGITNAIQIAEAYDHSVTSLPPIYVVAKGDGTVWTWGSGAHGLLGDGTTNESATPVQVPGLSGITEIAVGNEPYPASNYAPSAFALKNDGTIWSWGDNYNGQLGDGTTQYRASPVQVAGITNAVHLGTQSSAHMCAILADGTARCWGDDDYGQRGDHMETTSYALVQVAGLTNVIQILPIGFGTCALLADNTVQCWGTAGGLAGPFRPQFGLTGAVELGTNLVLFAGGTAAYGSVQIGNVSQIGGRHVILNDGTWWTFGENNAFVPASADVLSNLTLSALPAGTVSVGTTVTLTASASMVVPDFPPPAPAGSTMPSFEFWLEPPAIFPNNTSFSIIQPYSATSTYTWSTTGLAPGQYDFEVWVSPPGYTGSSSSAHTDLFITLQ